MERTSALDSAFLHVEDFHSSLHIASLGIFEGPAPSQAEILDAIAARLPVVPRLRQRLRSVPFSVGRPVWADDPGFTIENHVRRTCAAAPGGETELRELVDQVMSEHLDRDKPLWEDVVIEGLAQDRWALVTKVHHTMVDGIAGTDLLSTILDHAPTPDPAHTPTPAPTEPPLARASGPLGPLGLMADAMREQAVLRAREVHDLPQTLGHAVTHPVATARAAYETGRGLAGFASALIPTPRSSLIGPLGRDRAFRWTEVDLRDALLIRERLGGTLNDVVLAAVTRAFRDVELSRGEPTAARSVRCLVPVSVRTPGSDAWDNEVSALLLDLPVDVEDARDRLNEVSIRMHALKESHEADAGHRVTSIADALPPALLAGFLHLAFRFPHRNLTTVATNVPGPTSTLYLAGRRMLATYPYVPIADRLRIGIAVTSYDGRLLFGITTDRDSTPDAHVLAEGLEAGFAELVMLSKASRRRKEFR